MWLFLRRTTIESPKRFFRCMLYRTADGGTAATPSDSSTPGESGKTEETDESNSAQGK
jgi:hypothetical protein